MIIWIIPILRSLLQWALVHQENHGKTMGKYERNMGNDGKPWENIMEKPWENIGNYGETMGKP